MATILARMRWLQLLRPHLQSPTEAAAACHRRHHLLPLQRPAQEFAMIPLSLPRLV
jgi:hypothetical protein